MDLIKKHYEKLLLGVVLLGLAIAAEHCRLHGGRLSVDDNPDGHGARFLVELPTDTT